MGYQYTNDTGTIRSFNGQDWGKRNRDPDYREQDQRIDAHLKNLGVRPTDNPPPLITQCPNCGSRILHRTSSRIRCQGPNCGAILWQRPSAPDSKNVGDPTSPTAP